MGVLKFVWEWVKRLFSLVKLAQRLERLEAEVTSLKELTPIPKKTVGAHGIRWAMHPEDDIAYCAVCCAGTDGKWIPLDIEEKPDMVNHVLRRRLRCPACDGRKSVTEKEFQQRLEIRETKSLVPSGDTGVARKGE